MVAAMPHSALILSMAQIALAVFWVFSGNLKEKWLSIKKNTPALVLSSFFVIHLIGLSYSSDFQNGLNDLKIKLPLLLFPVIFAGSEKLPFKKIKLLILVFTGSLILKTIYGIILLSGLTGKEITEMSQLSFGFSHIRYSLLLNIAIFSIIYLLITGKHNTLVKVLYIGVVLWLSGFMFLLHSLTGWIIFIILLSITLILTIGKSKSKIIRFSSLISGVLTLIFIFLYIYSAVYRFNKTDTVYYEKLEQYTQEGNKYSHFPLNKQRENGHFVYLYICDKELKTEWEKFSPIKYDGLDKRNQKIKSTLIRYLTSKNLRKDSVGINQLTKKDIQNIENGIANYIYENHYAGYPKIYEVLWQIEQYNSGGTPNGHSVTQRIEFLKTGLKIIKEHFFFGVGTGGQKKAFSKQYEKSETKLSEKHRLRAHNQYLTIFITLGVFGFFWFILALFYLLFKNKMYKNYLFIIAFTVITLSMFNEDTIETQMGATIFAFFLSLFLLSDTQQINPLKPLQINEDSLEHSDSN
jgi:hypothetical protein